MVLDFSSGVLYDRLIGMTMKSKRGIQAIISAVFFGLLVHGCSPKNDRALILDFIERIGDRVEEKDTAGLMLFIDRDYKDFQNRGKKETEAIVRDYFRNYRGIVLHILGTRIDEIKEGEASVQTEVVLSSGAAEVFRKLFKAFGDFYRFDLELRKTGPEWRISYAKWQNIGLNDLSPEALSMLKKIFPGI
jgi:hypothetical protein